MQIMTKQHRNSTRAPRVHVPNKERAVVALGTQEIVSGILCKLSTTGGSMRLSKTLSRGTVADLTLLATSGRITSAVEFLGPADKGTPPAQAFRFIHMGINETRRLETVLEQMRKQGHGEKRSWKYHPIARVAMRTLSSLSGK